MARDLCSFPSFSARRPGTACLPPIASCPYWSNKRLARIPAYYLMPRMYIFSGLPGTGKTTLSRRLAQHVGAVYLRIDTIEQALRDLCRLSVEGEGYGLAYRIAADNLHLGFHVVADSCNPIELTRREWENVATSAAAEFVNIEVTCSDTEEHRRRIESRRSDIGRLESPDWQAVVDREYHKWVCNRVVVDTAHHSIDDCFSILISSLSLNPTKIGKSASRD